MRSAFTLCTYLHHLIVLTGGGYHGFSFYYIHADGFLYIHMCPCFYSIDSLQCMPMIGCANEYNVELIFREHFPVIVIKAGFLSRLLPLANHDRRFRQ